MEAFSEGGEPFLGALSPGLQQAANTTPIPPQSVASPFHTEFHPVGLCLIGQI